jgi:hypothetical protein
LVVSIGPSGLPTVVIFTRGESEIIPPAKSTELSRIKELMRKSPDIREDMVANLRTRIVRGIYKVKSEHVSEGVMQHGVYILCALGGNELRSL